MGKEKVVLDVGACRGEFGLEVARRNPDVKVHMIEPIPELLQKIKQITKKDNLKNVQIHELCLSTKDGEQEFNINSETWGVSSLLQFSKNASKDPYWATRQDLEYHKTHKVKTLTLKTFIERNNISNIDFIKIDTQGLDLDILQSSKDNISIINAGMLEVPTTKFSTLYEGESYDLQSALNWLTNNFEIMKIKPANPGVTECNIYFAKDANFWNKLIQNYNFKNLPVFNSTDFWYFPSNSPINSSNSNTAITEKEFLVIKLLRAKWVRKSYRFLKPILKVSGLLKMIKNKPFNQK